MLETHTLKHHSTFEIKKIISQDLKQKKVLTILLRLLKQLLAY